MKSQTVVRSRRKAVIVTKETNSKIGRIVNQAKTKPIKSPIETPKYQ